MNKKNEYRQSSFTNAAQLRMLDFISALELAIDDSYQLTVELGNLSEWMQDNPDLDIADHPRYSELVKPKAVNNEQ